MSRYSVSAPGEINDCGCILKAPQAWVHRAACCQIPAFAEGRFAKPQVLLRFGRLTRESEFDKTEACSDARRKVLLSHLPRLRQHC